MSKSMFLLILQFAFLFPAVASAIECIGPKDANTVAVYLHGMDSDPPSSQELANREILTAISKSLKIGFAVPRAKDKCPDKKLICWGWNFNDRKSVDSAIQSAVDAQKECFPNAPTSGLIGFSNGGFVANQIIKDCRKTDFKWLISIGAGGSWNQSDKSDLSNCGSLVLMAGKQDKFNYEPIKKFGDWLKERKSNYSLVEYDEGHNIPHKNLESVLKSLRAKRW